MASSVLPGLFSMRLTHTHGDADRARRSSTRPGKRPCREDRRILRFRLAVIASAHGTRGAVTQLISFRQPSWKARFKSKGHGPVCTRLYRGTSHNGTRSKTVRTDVGPMEITVPRDREGAVEPKIVRQRQKPLRGDKVRGHFPNEGRTEARQHRDHVPGLHRQGSSPLDHVLEDRTERLRHHLRRPSLSSPPETSTT